MNRNESREMKTRLLAWQEDPPTRLGNKGKEIFWNVEQKEKIDSIRRSESRLTRVLERVKGEKAAMELPKENPKISGT